MATKLWRDQEIEVPDTECMERGCWIDGCWGQYATDRIICIARDYGMPPTDERDEMLFDLAAARVEHAGVGDRSEVDRLVDALVGPNDGEEWQVLEELVWLADDAEAFLNAVVAETGCSFFWQDGELYYGSDDFDDGAWEPRFDESDCGGSFDGFHVYSDADPGL